MVEVVTDDQIEGTGTKWHLPIGQSQMIMTLETSESRTPAPKFHLP